MTNLQSRFDLASHSSRRLPQPIPYQGSKRLLAGRILAFAAHRRYRRIYEPFAGSAALTIAAAHVGLAEEYRISDSLDPLMGIWGQIITAPQDLADAYERLWVGQLAGSRAYFLVIRSQFNEDRDPCKLLYLLARCVKNAPRFNGQGDFNQSADKRRKGMRPGRMRDQVHGAHSLLAGHTEARCVDFEEAVSSAGSDDLVYLDPPYEGISSGPDRRYHQGVSRERLIEVLKALSSRGVPFFLSYDGRSGSKEYGPPLPDSIGAVRVELHAGRSSQATLLGRADETIESLYVSKLLLSDSTRLALPA